jgi:hypothetical protein
MAIQGGVRFLRGDNRGPARPRRMMERLVTALVVLGVVALLAAIVWGLGSERRALRALPDEQRLAVLSRTVDELRQSCGEGRPDALKKHCRELATFAAQFEECRGECEALVRRELAPAPPR